MAAGGAAAILTRGEAGAPARRLAIAGAATETVAMELMQRRLGKLAEPYRTGTAGILEKATMAVAGGGGAVLAIAQARKSRPLTIAGSMMTVAGSMLGRWLVFRAGFQSAASPEYTVEPQRARLTNAQPGV
jgi:hypothetical protein